MFLAHPKEGNLSPETNHHMGPKEEPSLKGVLLPNSPLDVPPAQAASLHTCRFLGAVCRAQTCSGGPDLSKEWWGELATDC